MNMLDGKELAKEILAQTSTITARTKLKKNIKTSLAIVVATNDESAHWYVRSIAKKADESGVQCLIIDLSPDTTEKKIADELHSLANDSNIHGIILQTPLPRGVNADNLLDIIPVEKDIDGANPASMGRLASGLDAFAPATAAAVMALLSAHDVTLEGKQAVVVGRSRIVGKPVAFLLLDKNCTVTICHSRTQNLPAITKQADVLVVAIGKKEFITSDYIKDGTVVIDVGTNVSDNGTLIGDVASKSVENMDIALTPVPGGVGPVTTAILLLQTAAAASKV